MTLDALNAADRASFVAQLGSLYEHSPWVAERAWGQRPFASVAALKLALAQAVRTASRDEQLALLRAHPELAGKAALAGTLTAASASEQSTAGLAHCTPDEFARLQQLNAAYNARFGWPFIVAVRGPRGLGLSRGEIIATLERRLNSPADLEFAECLRQVDRIAELRLNDALVLVPRLGEQVCDLAEQLAEFSDDGPARLTVAYLTDAHRACAQRLAQWMRDAGFDVVEIDAVGNVVGIYHGNAPDAPRLLTGSHFDTVRDAGRFDGRLGVLVPLVCVRELHRAGRRLPFTIELVAFAEEEGLRFPTAFLGSSALIGRFQRDWLALRDADGVCLADAMQNAGLLPDQIPSLTRDLRRYIGFVEVHIEQGPVLTALNLPLGVVNAINGSVRFNGEVLGVASHAGTTPMAQRRDAVLAVAELALFVERRARADADSVGTVGVVEVPAGAGNVVPGRCRFSLDLRAPTDAQRDRLCADVLAELQRICDARGLSHRLHETLRAASAPSASAWQARWERAVSQLGLPVHRLNSGAGHDAMKLFEALPQAMLFVRGQNGGISHNPLESITADDAELAVQAMQHLLSNLSHEPA